MAAKHPLDVLIRKLAGVQGFSKAERQAIGSLSATIREFSPQQDILSEGGYSSSCCIILDGWTCCYQMLDEGRRQILSFHVPGDVPDLQGLYLADTDFGMAALTAATVAFVPHTEVHKLIASFPTIATALWREALVGAAIHRAWMTGLGRRDARGRLAHLFCELYLRLTTVGLTDGYALPLPLRQPDLADALGLTPVHVNRTLRDLRNDGLISLRRRRLEIQDWLGLCTAAEFAPRYLHLTARENRTASAAGSSE